MKKIIVFCFWLNLIALFSSCSHHYLKKGNQEYDGFRYSKAIDYFEKSKSSSLDVKRKLANSYFITGNTKKAEEVYRQIVSEKKDEPIDRLNLAKALMSNEKFDDAKEWVEKYLQTNPSDSVAKNLHQSVLSLSTFLSDRNQYSLTEIKLDEKYISFMSPVWFNNQLVFSAQKKGWFKKDPESGEIFYRLYSTRKDDQNKLWIEPEKFKNKFRGRFNQGPVSFSKNNTEMYFTTNKIADNPDSIGLKVNQLKVYHSVLTKNKWKKAVSAPINNSNYSVGHAALLGDSIMFFVSDMPGGFGGADIYMSKYKAPSGWSKPINLGSKVNSAGNEMYPFAIKDTLYFSSNGHKGLGGLDVYFSAYNGAEWSAAQNLNAPISSSKDDYSYILNSDRKTGYLVSNREGKDKMYEFVKNHPAIVVKNNEDSLKRAQFMEEWKAKQKESLAQRVKQEQEEYAKYKALKKDSVVKVPVVKDTVVKAVEYKKPESTLFTKKVEIGSFHLIQHPFGKSIFKPEFTEELDKVIKVLKDNPTVIIEVSSHTDSRGNNELNEKLSQERATQVAKYFIDRGIPSNQIVAKGYGERMILNECKDGVECPDAKHKINRRTEIKVIGYLEDKKEK